MSDQTTGQRIEQSLVLICAELDEQRRQAAANQTAIMAKLDSILSHFPGVMRTIEIHTEQIRALEERPGMTNGKGAH
jgi:hypothetical protein